MTDASHQPSAKHPGDEAREVIDVRTEKEKQMMIDQLRKTPIIQLACEKLGIGRTTFYRWRREDAAFTQAAEEALSEGIMLMNDMAESQLLSGVRDGNLGAITYWLKHRHSAYGNRVEVIAKAVDGTLTADQQAAVDRALEFAGLLPEQPKEPLVSPSPSDHGSDK